MTWGCTLGFCPAGASDICFVLPGNVVGVRKSLVKERHKAQKFQSRSPALSQNINNPAERRSSSRIVVRSVSGQSNSNKEDRPNWADEGQFALQAALANVALGILVPLVAATAQSGGSWEETWHLLTTRYASHYELLGLLLAFGFFHSGLASLRPVITPKIGERAYRLIFAAVSIPFAVVNIGYFIAHRYDGMQLWTIQGVPGVIPAVWMSAFISFLFLYPATFNLLEIVAVQKPTFRLYETGIMRVTRHPQLWGQVIWCVSHTAWLGTTMPVVASAGLLAHHFLGAWNGDRRLKDKYGEEWEKVAERTSLIPFQAVLDGRQKLSFREFLKPAYIGVTAFTLGLFAAHPLMLRYAVYLPL